MFNLKTQISALVEMDTKATLPKSYNEIKSIPRRRVLALAYGLDDLSLEFLISCAFCLYDEFQIIPGASNSSHRRNRFFLFGALVRGSH